MIPEVGEKWQNESRAQDVVSRFRSSLRSWCCGRHRGRNCPAGIDQILQFLAGLEEWNFLGGNLNAIAGLGIAAHPRLALSSAKTPKTTNLDFVAHPERAHNAIEDGLDDDLTVFAR